eukprot:224293-Pleurochrysis_carterae.AAC.1
MLRRPRGAGARVRCEDRARAACEPALVLVHLRDARDHREERAPLAQQKREQRTRPCRAGGADQRSRA